MKKTFCSFLIILSVALLSGCAGNQLELIEKEQIRLRREYTVTRSEFDSIRTGLADTRANLEQIQQELNALKEKIEEVRYQLDRQIGKTGREGDQRIKELETRIAKIDETAKARDEELKKLWAALKGGSGEASTTADVAREKPVESEAAKKEYEETLKLIDRKDYRTAIPRFREFLKKYPNSDFGDNAQYWIGECYYALREFDQAILEFDAVRRKYPKGGKVPAALLKQGFAFAELGDKVSARLILQELVDRYPQSPEALKAKQKLKTLAS